MCNNILFSFDSGFYKKGIILHVVPCDLLIPIFTKMYPCWTYFSSSICPAMSYTIVWVYSVLYIHLLMDTWVIIPFWLFWVWMCVLCLVFWWPGFKPGLLRYNLHSPFFRCNILYILKTHEVIPQSRQSILIQKLLITPLCGQSLAKNQNLFSVPIALPSPKCHKKESQLFKEGSFSLSCCIWD